MFNPFAGAVSPGPEYLASDTFNKQGYSRES